MSILINQPNSEDAKYFYLLHFLAQVNLTGRHGHSERGPQFSFAHPIATSEQIAWDNIDELELHIRKEIESARSEKFSYFQIAGFTELQPPKKEKDGVSKEFYGGEYRVIDKSMNEVHEFRYRHEAADFYDTMILEHGEFREYELVAVISQHQPPEMLNLNQP